MQSLSDCEIPASSEFRPIQSLSEHEGYQSSSEVEKLLANLNRSDNNIAVNKTNNKKKRRRKKKTLSNEFKKETVEKIEDEEEKEHKLDDDNTIISYDSSENNDFKMIKVQL